MRPIWIRIVQSIVFTLYTVEELLLYYKMLTSPLSLVLHRHAQFWHFVCAHERTRGTHVQGELSSVARIKTSATETCVPPFLHWWHQVRQTHTHIHSFTHFFFHIMKSCPSLKCEWLSKLALLGHAGLVMGSDSLSCYKPQCGAGVKWHIERQRERRRERWNGACRFGLFSHPLMKRTASPQGLLEFLASGRMWDICPSVMPQPTN